MSSGGGKPHAAAGGTESHRPPLARLGLHRLTFAALALHAGVLVLGVIGFTVTGLSYVVSPLTTGSIVALWAVWLYHVLEPGRRPSDWAVAEGLAVFALILTFTLLAAPLQYVAVALRQPLIDEWLAAVDAAFGVHVPSVVEWTRSRPLLTAVLSASYYSLLTQFTMPVLVVGFWYRNRDALWEYLFHFHFCAIVTIVCLAVWPAACAFTFYGFESLLDQTRFIRHFEGLRTGAITVVDASDIEGLVSMPSFHVAGGLMVTWAFRAYPVWLWMLVVLNTLLIASTVLTGAHYAVDVFATLGLFALSVWIYRATGLVRWHTS